MKIINKQPIAFIKNLEKAFYKDNYQNRKLGRVGRPYGNSSNKEKEQNETEVEILVNKTKTLKNAEGKKLDAIIEYSNSAKEEGVEGIKVAKGATDNEKKIAIAKFYKEAAEGNADYLDEIVEEALVDYVPEKKKNKENFFSKLNNSIISKYKGKKESLSLSDIEEMYEDALVDIGKGPRESISRSSYINDAKQTYLALVKEWNKSK